MFNWNGNLQKYSLTATGIGFRAREYYSREHAEKVMHKYCKKFGLRIQEQYRDNHDMTYLCSWGIRFYIQRV